MSRQLGQHSRATQGNRCTRFSNPSDTPSIKGGVRGSYLVAVAGDDHSLALADIALEPCLRVLASRRLPCAHASAVRALAWAGPQLVSLGLDRRLRVWDLQGDSGERLSGSGVR